MEDQDKRGQGGGRQREEDDSQHQLRHAREGHKQEAEVVPLLHLRGVQILPGAIRCRYYCHKATRGEGDRLHEPIGQRH